MCYMLISVTSNNTYIGSTNNMVNRLNSHNNNNPHIKRKGAKRTRGQTWVPAIIITGFGDKKECLSFEAGWKRLSKRRTNNRLCSINIMSGSSYHYTNNPDWNRIMDLLYFMHNFTFLDTKFILNTNTKHPVNTPDELIINIMIESWIKYLDWPYFVRCREIY